jgi:hypothetical protein
VAQQRCGDAERDVRDDVVPLVEPEPQHVRVDDAHPTAVRTPQGGDPPGVDFDNDDGVGANDEQPRQGAVAGTELDDGPGRHEPREAGCDAAVDEEVLTEFVTTADVAAG